MDKRKMKKLLILNLPYFLVGLFATNLRAECSVEQPYHGGQKEAQEPQRTDSGYSRFR